MNKATDDDCRLDQEFIDKSVRPVLSELIETLLTRRPSNPVDYIADCLNVSTEESALDGICQRLAGLQIQSAMFAFECNRAYGKLHELIRETTFDLFHENLPLQVFHIILFQTVSSIDTIVLLQWSVKTDALLARLLSQIWKRIHHTKSLGAFHSSSFGIVRLCCLIIPRLRGRFPPNESSKPERMRRTCHLPHSLYLAEQLGIKVLQIGRSAHDVKMDTFGTQQRCPCLQSSLTTHHHDFHSTRAVNDQMHASDNLGPKKRFVNRIQLYQKLGTGSLEMRPIFPVHAGEFCTHPSLILSTYSFRYLLSHSLK
ncbi:hypothetical protein CSKR_201844 [Clonorchis sinensis]|uniref:Uncharacterized protein n=1 Tax=Clonorchis sinensis TaxID=79923 RepID=A0A8T1MY19_CLOSI|nr:hypothetical protein CSKR_201844 [Clonorchis sinensis]